MTPNEAWIEIEEHLEWVRGFKWYTLPEETQKAFAVVRSLVEGPTAKQFITAEQYMDLVKRLAEILFRLQPGWAFTGDVFTTLDAIGRALELRPTVEDVRDEIQRRLNNLPHTEPHDSAHILGSCLIDFIDDYKKGE